LGLSARSEREESYVSCNVEGRRFRPLDGRVLDDESREASTARLQGFARFRDPNEEGRVWVLFDWDAEGWQNFVSDPEVPAILQQAGHASRPQVPELAGELDG
jgi:hypothetical protein